MVCQFGTTHNPEVQTFPDTRPNAGFPATVAVGIFRVRALPRSQDPTRELPAGALYDGVDNRRRGSRRPNDRRRSARSRRSAAILRIRSLGESIHPRTLSTRAREMGDASGCDRSPGPLRNDAGNDAPRHRAPLAYRREGQRGDDHERPRPMRLLHVRQGRSEGRPLCLPAQIGVGPGQPPEPYGHWLAPKPAPSRMRAVAGSGETRLTRNKLMGLRPSFEPSTCRVGKSDTLQRFLLCCVPRSVRLPAGAFPLTSGSRRTFF